jgi:hypothetical protein
MRKMKLPTITKVRIPVLLALAVAEAFGLLHFYGQRSFVNFVFLSLSGILLINTLLLTDWVWTKQRKYRVAVIAFPMIAVLVALRYWNAGDHISSVSLAFYEVLKGTILRKLFSTVAPIAIERDPIDAAHGKIIPRDLFARIVCFSLGLFVSWLVAIRSWVYLSSEFWAVLASILALIGTLVAFTYFLSIIRERFSCKTNTSDESVTDQGGRA